MSTLLQDEFDPVRRRLLMNPSFQAREAREDYAMAAQLMKLNLLHIYGGGSAHKGHGYWLRYQDNPFPCHDPERFDGNLNPQFWTMDALNFAIGSAKDAFYGNNEELYDFLADRAGYEMNGTFYPANGMTLAECIRLVMQMPGQEPIPSANLN